MQDAGWRLLARDQWPGLRLSSPFTHSGLSRHRQEGLTRPYMPAWHRGHRRPGAEQGLRSFFTTNRQGILCRRSPKTSPWRLRLPLPPWWP